VIRTQLSPDNVEQILSAGAVCGEVRQGKDGYEWRNPLAARLDCARTHGTAKTRREAFLMLGFKVVAVGMRKSP
jgi:hypothetical protein